MKPCFYKHCLRIHTWLLSDEDEVVDGATKDVPLSGLEPGEQFYVEVELIIDGEPALDEDLYVTTKREKGQP